MVYQVDGTLWLDAILAANGTDLLPQDVIFAGLEPGDGGGNPVRWGRPTTLEKDGRRQRTRTVRRRRPMSTSGTREDRGELQTRWTAFRNWSPRAVIANAAGNKTEDRLHLPAGQCELPCSGLAFYQPYDGSSGVGGPQRRNAPAGGPGTACWRLWIPCGNCLRAVGMAGRQNCSRRPFKR